MQTTVYKIKNKDLPYRTGNYIQYLPRFQNTAPPGKSQNLGGGGRTSEAAVQIESL